MDELPQLINILKGEMSLVGPRPERPEFLDQLERALPDYRQRLTVRPGLTGLAQVQQPPDTDLSSVRRKLNYDLYYVERMNLWLDLRLILGTVLKCLGVPFVWIGRILQLPDPNAHLAANRTFGTRADREFTCVKFLYAITQCRVIRSNLDPMTWPARLGPIRSLALRSG